jgi:hypothetical protein
MQFYFRQLAPRMDWKTARERLWRSVDPLGREGSRAKEKAIERQILR